jgi:hypothetical protein
MNSIVLVQKNCQACNKIIKGRIDKKFCNDYCRNAYNNQLKSSTNNLVRNVNHFLAKNRRILESCFLNNETIIKIKKEEMLSKGFYFKYQTQIHQTKNNFIIYCCYNYLYFPLNENWVVVMADSK